MGPVRAGWKVLHRGTDEGFPRSKFPAIDYAFVSAEVFRGLGRGKTDLFRSSEHGSANFISFSIEPCPRVCELLGVVLVTKHYADPPGSLEFVETIRQELSLDSEPQALMKFL